MRINDLWELLERGIIEHFGPDLPEFHDIGIQYTIGGSTTPVAPAMPLNSKR
jgi:hypothetical protein